MEAVADIAQTTADDRRSWLLELLAKADQCAGAAAAFVIVGTETLAVSGFVQLAFPFFICNRFMVTFNLPCATSTSRK